MQIIITGGSGFLGQKLAKALVKSKLEFDELLLADINAPLNNDIQDERLHFLQTDLSLKGAAEALITSKTGIVFHLAAIVSSHAEQDFDLGWKINLDVTRNLLEACRIHGQNIRFIFSSSLAVFGGDLPEVVDDMTAVKPRSSYGAQKAMGELLVNDYSRKAMVDGIVLRLPTICVRPGRPNKAASSFVSSIIREPLQGEAAICPVAPELPLWLSSPETVINNFLHAVSLPSASLEGWKTVNLPGISVKVQEMLHALERKSDKATLARIKFEPDEAINNIVASWPGKLDNNRAEQLGFKVDNNFDEIIDQFIKNDMVKAV